MLIHIVGKINKPAKVTPSSSGGHQFYIQMGVPHSNGNGGSDWTNYNINIYSNSQKQYDFFYQILVDSYDKGLISVSATNQKITSYTSNTGQILNNINLLNIVNVDPFKYPTETDAQPAPGYQNQQPANNGYGNQQPAQPAKYNAQPQYNGQPNPPNNYHRK